MKKEGMLYSRGELDVLDYYSQISKYLVKFLKRKELATKTILKGFQFLKRGSNSPPLFIEDMNQVNNKMLKLRTKHLDEAKSELTGKQVLIWRYFVPRKLVNFFYATNGENSGKSMDRIFIDIDRQTHSSEDARKVAIELVNQIKQDKEFHKLVKFRIFIMWTGSSFHVYLFLKDKVNLNFYQKYLSYGNNKPVSFLMKWAESISKETKIRTKAGHEREKDSIILDSSNTPSGKLARVPFSLHIKDYQTVDGIAVPLSEKELGYNNLIEKLTNLTPDLILKNIKRYAKLV